MATRAKTTAPPLRQQYRPIGDHEQGADGASEEDGISESPPGLQKPNARNDAGSDGRRSLMAADSGDDREEESWADSGTSEREMYCTSQMPAALEIDASLTGADGCGDESSPPPPPSPPLARRLLYASHFVSSLAESAWQFVLVVVLSRLAAPPSSLFLVSSYGLASGMATCTLGGTAGRYIDRTERLRAVRAVCGGRNLCVILCTAACCTVLMLHPPSAGDLMDSGPTPGEVGGKDDVNVDGATSMQKHRFSGVPSDLPTVLALIFVHILGALVDVFSQATTVALEKDWVVVMGGGDGAWLRQTNVAMRQIDLTCKMVGPAGGGFFLLTVGEERLLLAMFVVGVFHVVVVAVEYVSTARIYVLVPGLAKEANQGNARSGDEGQDTSCCVRPNMTANHFAFSELRVYMSQVVWPGGLALALLYLNVLSVGELMTSFLLWRGVRMDFLGIWRGLASVIGLLGTITFHISSSKLSLKSTAMWSIALFFFSLSVCFASLFRDDALALSMLAIGICASRVGLWTFDMSITQLMQELVEEGCRGSVGGTQHSLQAFFFMLQFLLGLALPDPMQFHELAAFGYGAVGLAFLLVLRGIFFNRRIGI